MLGKDEKLDSEKFHYNSHLDTNDYDGMGNFSRFGNSRKINSNLYTVEIDLRICL